MFDLLDGTHIHLLIFSTLLNSFANCVVISWR